ncbi:Uncharacterized conserved protein [Noviherbaspirillum humi]|uniref:Uncharacterized conserved protein n=1 Tax=Noviherbaspirillum humi TaxID=1688639 RepID=A0A239JSZ9_9BURK|nr:hypothetical protein [Noviherbaspirillum humi]SNT08879.1 Uncharacterized conserved protein [Noviherbaspirillum humi]
MSQKKNWRRAGALIGGAALLAGCAAPVYTVDDGSPVDERLLAAIRIYGKGEQAIRPAIVRSAALKDPDCDTQYDLPFAVAFSYDLPKEKRIAWARGLAVDERLSVIAADPESGLSVGDKLEELDGYNRRNTAKMALELQQLRNRGKPFEVKLADGKTITVKPVKVCRGYTTIAQPEAVETLQDYHWEKSVHPLSLFAADLNADEALWITLWTQGLSEETGARMKTYVYGSRLLKTGLTVASLASGVGAVSSAANQAAAAAGATAGRAASQAALEAAGKKLAEQAADRMRQSLIETVQKAVKAQAQELALDAIKAASVFRDSLSGVSWIASTGFDLADKWALERMTKLDADPLASFSLHAKLAQASLTQNSFVFDEARLKQMTELAAAKGIGEQADMVLAGLDPKDPVAVERFRSERQKLLALARAIPVKTLSAGDTTYHGAFEHDVLTGKVSGNGKVSWANGDAYEGELVQGVRAGRGRMVWANGQSYDGLWQNDMPNGAGNLSFANGDAYEGEVAAGVPHGKGRMRFAGGNRYEGDFDAGLPHGTGQFTWANGDRYEGQWQRNLHHGDGRFFWSSGDVWEGVFAEGRQTEQGVLKRRETMQASQAEVSVTASADKAGQLNQASDEKK